MLLISIWKTVNLCFIYNGISYVTSFVIFVILFTIWERNSKEFYRVSPSILDHN
jgi:hypothetical protein